jgi:hypothetical protein
MANSTFGWVTLIGTICFALLTSAHAGTIEEEQQDAATLLSDSSGVLSSPGLMEMLMASKFAITALAHPEADWPEAKPSDERTEAAQIRSDRAMSTLMVLPSRGGRLVSVLLSHRIEKDNRSRFDIQTRIIDSRVAPTAVVDQLEIKVTVPRDEEQQLNFVSCQYQRFEWAIGWSCQKETVFVEIFDWGVAGEASSELKAGGLQYKSRSALEQAQPDLAWLMRLCDAARYDQPDAAGAAALPVSGLLREVLRVDPRVFWLPRSELDIRRFFESHIESREHEQTEQ